MAEDLHKDNLEDFFKDSFEEQSDLPAEDGWDVPSNRVWEGVETAIQNKDDDGGGFYWRGYIQKGIIILALFLLAISTAMYFTSKEEINEDELPMNEERVLNQNQEKNNEPILRTQEEIVDEVNPYNTNENNQLQENNSIAESNEETKRKEVVTVENNSRQNNELRETPENQNNAVATKSEKPATVTANKTPDNSTPSPSEKNKDIAMDSNETSPQSNIDLPDSKDEITALPNASNPVTERLETNFDVLAPIPTKGGLITVQSKSVDSLQLPLNPFFDLDEKTAFDKRGKGFYAGISAAPTYTSRQVKAKGNSIAFRNINKNEMAQLSFSAGMNLGYQFSPKWSIESGFSYSRLALQHRGRKQVRYTTIGEQLVGGRFQRNYNFDLGTSSGDINADVVLARETSTPIPENEFIALQIKAQQKITFGSVPLIVRYQFGKGKLQASLKTGIVNRFVLDGAFQIEEVRVARNGVSLILNDRIYRSRPLRNIKKYQADFLVGAGASYHFNKKIWLTIEPTLTRSITPLYEGRNFKTFPTIVSLDIGLNYKF